MPHTSSDSDNNPYRAPLAAVDADAAPGNDVRQQRREHLNHEASLRSIGSLYYLGGVGLALAGASQLISPQGTLTPAPAATAVALLALALVFFWLGTGIRRLMSWVRIPVTVLSVIGLLGFPTGTLINGYILYLLLSPKGRTILSAEYREVVAATPDIKYRTSIVVWIAVAILVLLVVAALVMSLLK